MAMHVACARNPARDGLPDYAELAADRGARHRGLNGVSRSASPSPPRIASRAANPLVLNCAVCGLIIIRSTHRPTHRLGCDCAHPLVTHNRRASGAHCPSRSCHAALGKCRVHWGEELVLVFSTGGNFKFISGHVMPNSAHFHSWGRLQSALRAWVSSLVPSMNSSFWGSELACARRLLRNGVHLVILCSVS